MISSSPKSFTRKNTIIFSIILLSTISSLFVSNAFAEVDSQTKLTSDGSLKVKIESTPTIPSTTEETKIKVEFIDPQTENTQVHIDYRVLIETDEEKIFETKLVHTSIGIVTIPYRFSDDGVYFFKIIVEGILFMPIPEETASFEIHVGDIIEQTTQKTSIPSWIKNNAGWWADGSIDDDSFVQGIQFLIKENVLKIPPTTQGSSSGTNEIPSWIKNNAGWWADGSIDDDSFVQGIQFLITNGIISIQ